MTLHYVNDDTSKVEVTKDARKYLYFTALRTHIKYRMNKETKEIQVSPYWNTLKKMYLSEED